MADVVPLQGLHDVRGFTCDLCAELCDPEAHELNALDCTFPNCPKSCSVYHQDCLEKYLKSIRLEKNRKTGFKCPRGCGKLSTHEPCPGKIDKSHPIHLRNDSAKKKKKALVPMPEKVKQSPKEKAASAASNTKEKDKKAKEAVRATPTKTNGVDKGAAGKKGASANSANNTQLAALAAARAELQKGKAGAVQPPVRATPSKPAPAMQTLDEFEAAKAGLLSRNGGRGEGAGMNAWTANQLAKGVAAPLLDLSSVIAFPAPQPSRSSNALASPTPAESTPRPLSLAAWIPSNPVLNGGSSTTLSSGGGSGGARGTEAASSRARTGTEGEVEEEPNLTRAQRKILRRKSRLKEASASAAAAVGDSAMDAASEGASEGRVTGSGDGDWETPRETAPSTVQRPHVVSQDPARDWEAAPGIFGGLGGAFRGPERDWGGAASSLHAAGGHLGHPAGDWDATAGFPHTLVPPQKGDSSLSASLKESVISALEKSHARFLLGQLQDLGFPEWQCRAAIALNGSDLLSALVYLLEEPAATPEDANLIIKSIPHAPHLDITLQWNNLADIQRGLEIPWGTLAQAVVELHGDVEAAVTTILERAEETSSSYVQPFPVGNGSASDTNGLYSASGMLFESTTRYPEQPMAAQYQQPAAPAYQQQHYQPHMYGLPNGHGYPQGPRGLESQMPSMGAGAGFWLPMEASQIWGPSRNAMDSSHVFSGMGMGRPESSASLGNAESASTWSADSVAAYPATQQQGQGPGGRTRGTHATQGGPHAHPLQSEESSTQSSATALSRHDSGSLSLTSSQPLPFSQYYGFQGSFSNAANPASSHADVDAMFEYPQQFDGSGLLMQPHSIFRQDTSAAVPLFARGSLNAVPSNQPLYMRGMESGRSEGKPEEAAGGGSTWQERTTWHYERQGEAHPDAGGQPLETPHDLESFVSKVLDGGSS